MYDSPKSTSELRSSSEPFGCLGTPPRPVIIRRLPTAPQPWLTSAAVSNICPIEIVGAVSASETMRLIVDVPLTPNSELASMSLVLLFAIALRSAMPYSPLALIVILPPLPCLALATISLSSSNPPTTKPAVISILPPSPSTPCVPACVEIVLPLRSSSVSKLFKAILPPLPKAAAAVICAASVS